MPPTPPTRVVSLLPGATEWIVALGAADRLVGISHECDHPAGILDRPRVTTTAINFDDDSATIDAQVRQAVAAGRPVIAIDADRLRQLGAELVVTQDLCEVCAVADGEVHRLAEVLDPAPRVLTLDGRTVPGVFADGRRLAAELGVADRGEAVVTALEARLAALAGRTGRPDPPGVVVIEWLDPCFLAGHWTPELIAAAGGRDLAMRPGEHSVARPWSEVIALDPELVVIALCGFGVERAEAELDRLEGGPVREWLEQRRVVVIDGNAYTSRAGPRLVEAAELLAEALDESR